MVAGIIISAFASIPVAASSLSYTQIATHPYASAQPDGTNKSIRDIAFEGNTLIGGYGDWNANTDSDGNPSYRVGIVPLDLSANTWGGITYTDSEANTVIRTINGKLYAPSTDPSIFGQGGYTTNASGIWEHFNKIPEAVHTFDIATLDGSDLWLFGAQNGGDGTRDDVGQASAWRSTDNGNTWNLVQSDVSTPPDAGAGFERYYWGATLNGKMYIHAGSVSPEAPLRVFDGTSWSTSSVNFHCDNANTTIVFDGHIICPASTFLGGVLSTFDGTTVGTIQLPNNDTSVNDFYTEGGYLYMLTNSAVYRTSSLSSPFVRIGSSPVGATSLGIKDDYLYVGTDSAKILKSNTTVTDALAIPANPTDCFGFDNTSGTITSYTFDEENGCTKDVVIPNNIGGIPVTALGDMAFYNKGLTSVVIPNTVTSIGVWEFDSNKLTSVVIPDSVTTMMPSAFASNRLTTVSISAGLTKIEESAFFNNALTNVSIPSGVTTIGISAFNSNSLTTLSLPSSVTQIDENAFGYNQLTDIQLPSVQQIGNGAFQSNQLSTVTFSNTLTSIGSSSFYNNQLKTLAIPSSVTDIGDAAFYQNQLTSLTLPNSPIQYGTYVFKNNLLTAVKIPSLMTDIPEETFSNNKLSSLTIENGVTSIGTNAFTGNRLHSVTVPSTLTSISASAFSVQSDVLGPYEFAGDITFNDEPALKKIYYTRLYTSDPSNPQQLESTAYILDEQQDQQEYNNDGDLNDIFNLGGYIVNPAQAVVRYKSLQGRTIHANTTITGATLASYNVSENTNNDLARYYTLGKQLSINPLMIRNFTAPSSQNVSLAASTNVTFTYTSNDPAAGDINAPNTGLFGAVRHYGVLIIALFSATFILTAIYVARRALFSR